MGESADDVEKWKNDSSIPLAQVVSGFKIMITHKQGAQGQLDGASKSQIENEFGSSDEDEAIKQILTKGTLQVSENSERSGDTISPRVAPSATPPATAKHVVSRVWKQHHTPWRWSSQEGRQMDDRKMN